MVAVVITGAANGLGAALASCYARPGNILFLMDCCPIERLEAVANNCRKKGAISYCWQGNVENQTFMKGWFDEINKISAIDIVFVNAGVTNGNDKEDLENTSQIILTNLYGSMTTVYEALRIMKESNKGQIVIINSPSAFCSMPHTTVYSSCKRALYEICDSLKLSLSDHGIEIIQVFPGFIITGMSRKKDMKRPFSMTAEQAADKIVKNLILGKKYIYFPTFIYIISLLLGYLPRRVRHNLIRLILQ